MTCGPTGVHCLRGIQSVEGEGPAVCRGGMVKQFLWPQGAAFRLRLVWCSSTMVHLLIQAGVHSVTQTLVSTKELQSNSGAVC